MNNPIATTRETELTKELEALKSAIREANDHILGGEGADILYCWPKSEAPELRGLIANVLGVVEFRRIDIEGFQNDWMALGVAERAAKTAHDEGVEVVGIRGIRAVEALTGAAPRMASVVINAKGANKNVNVTFYDHGGDTVVADLVRSVQEASA